MRAGILALVALLAVAAPSFASGDDAAARRQSRTAYENMGRDDAVALAKRTFDIERRLWLPPATQMGATFERFAGDHAEVVEVHGQRLLATSTTPLRVTDDAGDKVPMSLSLVARDGMLVPEHPLAPVAFAADGSGQMSFAGGIAVAPLRTGGAAPAQAGNRLVYANSGLDSDYMAEPVPAGGEVFWQLRSERSPDPGLRFSLPPGARLEAGAEGAPGARVVRDGQTLLDVSPATAHDADGTNVPTSMTVAGDTLSIRVDLGGDIRFPVEVDPTISISSGTNAAANEFYGWFQHDTPAGWFQFAPYYNLLHVSADPAQHAFSTWNWGAWTIQQHGDAKLARADIQGMEHGPATQSAWAGGMYSDPNNLTSWMGTWTTNGYAGNMGNANYGNTSAFSGLATAYCAYAGPGNDSTGQLCDYSRGATGFQFSVFLAGALTVTNYSRIGGASIIYVDANGPGTPSLNGIPAGWVTSLPGVTLGDSDGGVGVQNFTVDAGGQVQSQGESCGSPYSFCPGSDTKTFNFSSPPEGSYTVSGWVSDEVGNGSPTASATAHVDHSDPTVAASGTLWNDRGIEVVDGDFPVTVTGSDPYSGVHDVHLYVDGTDVGLPASSCDANSGCPTSPAGQPWTFHSASYAAGPHTFRIGATDAVGHAIPQASQPSWTVTVDRPPASTALPTVSGTATDGRTLTATAGSWSGWPAPTFTYQWQRCSGATCANITGATAQTYTLQHADVGSTVRVVVTAWNSVGQTPANSAQTATVAAAVPVNLTAPTVTGSAADGQVLTAHTQDADWSGTPPFTYAYQWQQCTSAGACTNVAGATLTTFRVRTADIGYRLRVVVTASNAVGQASASSASTATAVAGAPVNLVPPTITGNAVDGQVLAAHTQDSDWAGTLPFTYTYQWQQCTGSTSCTDIAGATASTYRARTADVGDQLRVVVTAHNNVGPTSTPSPATAAVAAGAPVNLVAPGATGTVRDGQTVTAYTHDADWAGTPSFSYAYQWQRCSSSTGPCSDLAGVVGPSYTFGHADAFTYMRVAVTATNSVGSGIGYTGIGYVDGIAPKNLVLPTVSGTPKVGEKLTVTTHAADWDGSPVGHYYYQWQQCVDAAGACTQTAATSTTATTNSYTLQDADAGHRMQVLVQAKNADGYDQVYTVRTAAVLGADTPADTTLATLPGQSTTDPGASSLASLSGTPEPTTPLDQPTQAAPLWVGSAAGHTAAQGYFGGGFSSPVIAYGGGTLFVGSGSTVRTYDADHPDTGSTGSFAPLGGGPVTGLASYRGELYVATGGSTPSVAVYTPAGLLVRRIGTADVLGTISDPGGLAVAWGQVYVLDTERRVDAEGAEQRVDLVKVFDAQTGALTGLAFSPVDSEPTWRRDAGRDVSAGPEADLVVVGRRALWRVQAVGPLLASWPDTDLNAMDVGQQLDRDATVDWCACPAQRGTDWVWGMRWLLSVDEAGARIDEYGPGTLRRSWAPRQKDGSVNDVVYRKRSTSLDWGGKLTDSDHWLAGVQSLDYAVTNGDIYPVGAQGEHWFELAPNVDHVELAIDGTQVTSFTSDSTPVTQAEGTLRFDTAAFPNGTHTLALTAVLASGQRVTLSRTGLRLDNVAPVGELAALPSYVRQTRTLSGQMSDPDSGPLDWKLSVRRTTDQNGAAITPGAWQVPCGAVTAGPYACDWQTGNVHGYPDGRYDVVAHKRDRVLAEDGGPNEADTQVETTTVDNTPPVSTIAGAPSGWTQADPVNLSVAATDNLSGVADVAVSDNTTSLPDYSGGGPNNASIGGEGTHDVTATATDGAGNVEAAPPTVTVRIDHTPPVTAASGLPACGGWATTDPTVTLTSADQPSLSGVRKLTDVQDGGIPDDHASGSTSIPFTTDGHHSLAYQAIDNAGNLEAFHSCAFGVDTVPPRTFVSDVPTGWTNQDVAVTLSPVDATSGVDHLHVDKDGTATDYPGAATQTITYTTEAVHTLNVRAYDVAGNVEAEQTKTIRIDKTPPTSTASGVPSGWSAQPVTVTVTADDGVGHSGVAAIHYTINGGSEHVDGGASTQIPFASDGSYALHYWAVDSAGNSETAHDAMVRVDQTPPTVSLSGALWDAADGQPLYDGTGYPLHVSASDAGSGVATVDIAVDGMSVDHVDVSCPDGGCGQERYFTFRTNMYPQGSHHVLVTVHDQVSRATTQDFDIEVERDSGVRTEPAADADGGMGSATAAAPGRMAAPDGTPAAIPTLACTSADQPTNFPVYSVGQSFEGLPLTYVGRDCEAPVATEPARANLVTYIYGSCDLPTNDGGCSNPLEVQSWPACERNLASYVANPWGDPVQYDPITVQGTDGALFDDGTRLEVYAGVTTIVIFGADAAQVRRAADALREEPVTAPPGTLANAFTGARLAPPAPGALDGQLSCSYAASLAAHSVQPLTTAVTTGQDAADETLIGTRDWILNHANNPPSP